MIKIFECFDLMEAGRVQSLLESRGIKTFLKNEFSAGAVGELPFQEVAPQLFLLDEKDIAEANRLIRSTSRDA